MNEPLEWAAMPIYLRCVQVNPAGGYYFPDDCLSVSEVIYSLDYEPATLLDDTLEKATT